MFDKKIVRNLSFPERSFDDDLFCGKKGTHFYRTNPPLFVRLVLSDCFRELVTIESLHTHYAPQQTRLQLQRKWEKGGEKKRLKLLDPRSGRTPPK